MKKVNEDASPEGELEDWDHDEDDDTPPISLDTRGVMTRHGQEFDVYVSRVERAMKLIWVRITDPLTHGYGTVAEPFRWVDRVWKHAKNPNIKLLLK